MSKSDPIIPPSIGSFPFYEEAVRLGKTWTQLWLEQGSIWNDQWGKLKDGSYEAKDWYSALVRSTELSASALSDLFTQLTGNPTPPFKSLSLNSKEEVDLRLRVALNGNETVSVSELSLLGDQEPGKPRPVIEATPVQGDPRRIILTLKKPVPEIPKGQYIGFVMRSSDPEPIAIVTLSNAAAEVPNTGRAVR